MPGPMTPRPRPRRRPSGVGDAMILVAAPAVGLAPMPDNPPGAATPIASTLLIASPRCSSRGEAAQVRPGADPSVPARDAFARLLHRPKPDPAALRDEARPMVHRKRAC